MVVFDIVIIFGCRLAIFLGYRTIILPLLYGQARYAALEANSASAQSSPGDAGLPRPATSSNGNGHAGAAAWKNLKGSASSVRTAAGWKALRAEVMKQSSLVAALFSYALEEATMLFVLVILEAAGYDRLLLKGQWDTSLLGTLSSSVIFIPLGICLLLASQGPSASILKKLLWSLLPYTIWLIIFLKVPLPASASAALAEKSGGFFNGLLSSALLRIAVIGITLLALLSGSAAMAAAWDAYDDLMLITKSRGANGRGGRRTGAMIVNAQDVSNAEASFERTLSDLESKRATTSRLQEEQASGLPSQPGASEGSFIGRLNPFSGGDARAKEIKTLRSEIWALENLAKNMRDDLETMRERERRLKWSRTWNGRLLILLGWGFALYCVLRIALALFSLLILGYKDTAPPDFVSYGLASLLHLFSIDVDIAAWTRQISLMLIGVLIVMRMRIVLQYLSSAFKLASTGASSSFLVLFLAEITVMYLLATLIQLKTSLPTVGAAPGSPIDTAPSASPTIPASKDVPPVQIDDQPLLASLPSFQVVFGSLFDSAFLLAAAATGVVKWLAHKNDLDAGGTMLGTRD